MRQIRIHGAGGPNEPSFWQREVTVDISKSCGALFGHVFKMYNYVHIFSPAAIPYNGIPQHELKEYSCLLAVLINLNMNVISEDVIDIWAANKEQEAPAADPRYRQVRIYGTADDLDTNDKFWTHEARVLVDSKVGDVLKDVFDTYNYVCVTNHVPFGKLQYHWTHHTIRTSLTTLKTVIDTLGLHQGVIKVYAKNVVDEE